MRIKCHERTNVILLLLGCGLLGCWLFGAFGFLGSLGLFLSSGFLGGLFGSWFFGLLGRFGCLLSSDLLGDLLFLFVEFERSGSSSAFGLDELFLLHQGLEG